jgi:hypothetical protein
MKDIKNLTLAYIKSFNDKSIDQVLMLADEDIYLKDPSNEFFNKSQFQSFLEVFFENDISFSAKQIMCEGNTSVIHFDLKVNDKILNGVDIIKWEDGKMVSLIAYL